ncbi:MAG: hypothetical protein IKI55_01735, partial [Bacilli bacterium]|nr:hypothetical protein [Bacilli bacterium]
LTEGPAPKGNDANQVIARADVLEGTNVEATSDTSDRKHPDTYYVLDSTDKSVSYSFDVSSAFTGQVVAYLGNPSDSTSKKIADAISCEIDGSDIEMNDLTYKEARMGKCTVSGSSRTNYWPVILGTAELGAGNHTITITGTSEGMNIGGIYIFDNATAGGSNGIE